MEMRVHAQYWVEIGDILLVSELSAHAILTRSPTTMCDLFNRHVFEWKEIPTEHENNVRKSYITTRPCEFPLTTLARRIPPLA